MRSLSKLCVLLLAAGLLIAPASGTAASKSKKKKSKTEEVAKPKVDKYTKMFVNDKSCQTAKGPFLTLHKLKGKLYVEVPLKTIGREMLIASTISEASDTNLGTIGYKPTDPIHVKFTRIDTTIYLSQAVVPPSTTRTIPTWPRPSAGAPSRRSCTPTRWSATTVTARPW